MKPVLAAFATMTVLCGCANMDPEPSYLGMAAGIDASGAPAVPNSAPPPAVRHVNSNRVLGAMAFQRTTGADVDPTSLVGSARAP